MQFFLILSTWSCVIALAAAMPHDRDPAESFMLSDVAGKTLCPMRVTSNKNEKRIPRYIKFVTCDVQESPSSDSQLCSYNPDGDHMRSCVQLVDYAPVQYLTEDGSFENSTLKVPVGCACLSREARAAIDLTR